MSYSYENFELFMNKIKFNVKVILERESEEINFVCKSNIIEIKNRIEIFLKELKNQDLKEFIEQIGYDIIYYSTCCDFSINNNELNINNDEFKINNALLEYLKKIQNSLNKKLNLKY